MATYDDDMLKQLAAEADAFDEAFRAEVEAKHGPLNHSEAFYGVHGSHSSPSVR